MYISSMRPETPSIRQAARQIVRELHLLDGRHCIEGYSFSQCHFITELNTLGQATASELAERLVLEKSTLSRLCKGLVDSGHVVSKPNPADTRQKLLRLNTKGKRAAEQINRYSNNQVNQALSFVADQDRATLVAGLERYAKSLRYARLASEYRIRKITESDNPSVARIIRDVMTEYGATGEGYSIQDPEVDDMFHAYPENDSMFYVITRNKQVLGCGGIGPLSGGDPATCELRKMYFLQELRGTGMGTRLLNQCLDSARQLGYQTCYLETLESMVHARHLYCKNGFQALKAPLGQTGHSKCNAWMAMSLQ